MFGSLVYTWGENYKGDYYINHDNYFKNLIKLYNIL